MWDPEGIETERTVRVVTATCPAGLPAGSGKRPILTCYKCKLVSWEAEKVKELEKSLSLLLHLGRRIQKERYKGKKHSKMIRIRLQGKRKWHRAEREKGKSSKSLKLFNKAEIIPIEMIQGSQNRKPDPCSTEQWEFTQQLEGSRKPDAPPGAGCLAVPCRPMGGASWRPGTAGSDELSFWVIMPKYALL